MKRFFLFVTLLLNAIWSYSKAATSVNIISQKASSWKQVQWSFRGLRLCGHAFSKKMLFIKSMRLHSHLIFRFCSDYGNKNIEILLQLSRKRLMSFLIHNISFTVHNYRLSAIQIQSWYSSSRLFLTVWQQDLKFWR